VCVCGKSTFVWSLSIHHVVLDFHVVEKCVILQKCVSHWIFCHEIRQSLVVQNVWVVTLKSMGFSSYCEWQKNLEIVLSMRKIFWGVFFILSVPVRRATNSQCRSRVWTPAHANVSPSQKTPELHVCLCWDSNPGPTDCESVSLWGQPYLFVSCFCKIIFVQTLFSPQNVEIKFWAYSQIVPVDLCEPHLRCNHVFLLRPQDPSTLANSCEIFQRWFLRL